MQKLLTASLESKYQMSIGIIFLPFSSVTSITYWLIWMCLISIRQLCQIYLKCILISRSALVHVIAFCLTAICHHMKYQCWIIFSEILRHSAKGNFTGNAQYRWHPAKRALPAMLTHGGWGPFGRIPSIYLSLIWFSKFLICDYSHVFQGPMR